MTIPISEEFSSIQGEGMFTGAPSYFVRTSGCNLRCSWCDTPYTSWKPEQGKQEVNAILGRIAVDDAMHVVITGGEPMLYPEAVYELLKGCARMGKITTIETNGTKAPGKLWPDLWSVSPKLASSTPLSLEHKAEAALHKRNIEATDLREFVRHVQGVHTQFKFVVTCADDLKAVRAMCIEHKLPRECVWLMPEGRTREEVLEKSAWVAAACKDHGYNLSMRVHTLLWGAKRGV